MRKLFVSFALTVAFLVAAPMAARADWVIEGSVGKGARLNPSPVTADPTNIMLAPGYQLLGMLRLQLGVVGTLADVENSKYDLQLRPMLGIYPPILPLYARVVFAVEDILHDVHYGVGGAGGLKLGLPFIGIGIFAEVGVIPRFVASKEQTVVEGRLGAYWAL